MSSWVKDRIKHPLNKFYKRKQPQNATFQSTQPESRGYSTADIPQSSSASLPGTLDIQSKEPSAPKDLWEVAYEQLDKTRQDALSTVEVAAQPNSNSNSNRLQTTHILDEIVQTTKEQYEEYQIGGLKIMGLRGEIVDIRKLSETIINAALSFKRIIDSVAASDPTCHASSAWAIVSLGLTMTQNQYDLRNALFQSSEYLADVLARCACIEENFYNGNATKLEKELERAIIRTYRAILCYAAEVRIVQKRSKGRWMLDTVTAITDQSLTNLKSSIDNEEKCLHQQLQIHEHLHRRHEAQNMLAEIDKILISLQDLKDDAILSKLHGLDGASFDAYTAENDQNDELEGRCLPGTRTELLKEVTDWGSSPKSQCIFWLSGMAGTGKSTISRTVAAMFKEKGILGASFFFKKGAGDQGNAKRLFSTIAKQLVNRVPQIIPGIRKAVNQDPDIATKSLQEQFKSLLLQPLLDLEQSNRKKPLLVIVIDALDECEQKGDISTILCLLPQVQKIGSMMLHFFLTSRPRLPISLGFKKMGYKDHQYLVLQEVTKPVIERDISLFLKFKFSKIREYNDDLLPPNWPGDEKLNTLVRISFPLFIFAATVCRFVEGEGAWPPDRLLEDFLRDPATHSASEMDRTYLPILNQALTGRNETATGQLMEEFHETIGVMILLATPLSVHTFVQLICPEGDIGIVTHRLKTFYSVLNVPSEPEQPVRILHLSFRDFLLKTKTKFHVDEQNTHKKITAQCLRVMRSSLKHNICELPSYGTERTAIRGHTINQYLSPELQYSCHYWAFHFERGNDHVIRMDDALLFLEEHFLHWLEAMSIMGIVSEAASSLNALQSVMKDKAGSEALKILHDAKQFIIKNMHIADVAPLQLYCSGLTFAPAIVREKFKKELPSWIHVPPRVEESWGPGLQTLEGHLDLIHSVVISPDSHLVASGSGDNTIRLWDAATGTLQQSLEGHSGSILSVMFSSDSCLVASGSRDKTVRVWSATTGALQHILEGHSHSIQSVVFSPDNCSVASGSEDNTVKLWDITTGALQQTLKGHSDSINSVVFSPDNCLVISGSRDKTVRVWDATTGALQHILEGHSHSIQSMELSSKTQLVASGSADNTISLWDSTTGTLEHILKGHSDIIWSVALSQDSCLVASGSSDKTVRVWDVTTGALRHVFEGHTSIVWSVAFSQDSCLVASGSGDSTIRLWDIITGTLQQIFEGHTGIIWSVAFSPDSCLVASGSSDYTVRLWDTTTRALQETFEGHSDMVWSVAFSPDNCLVVSGSSDCTIRLWNTATGALQQTFKGHLDLIYSVAFSSDGCLIASGSKDKMIKIWDATTRGLKQIFEGHSGSVWSVAFSQDSCLVASGSSDKTVRVWDATTGALRHVFEGHTSIVWSVAFSQDSCLVASGSSDCTVRLWDATTGALKQILHTEKAVQRLSFSEQGPYLDTNCGSFDIQPWCTTIPAQINTQVSIKDGWIVHQDEKILWLPFEYRYFGCSAVKDDTLAFGYESGRVAIIRFCI